MSVDDIGVVLVRDALTRGLFAGIEAIAIAGCPTAHAMSVGLDIIAAYCRRRDAYVAEIAEALILTRRTHGFEPELRQIMGEAQGRGERPVAWDIVMLGAAANLRAMARRMRL